MSAISSDRADAFLPSTRLLCSREVGWRSLLLRVYADPVLAEPFVLPGVSDLKVVLNARGYYRLGCRESGRWIEADYTPGTIGMTAPGEQDELRWRAVSDGELRSVHLFLPATAIDRFVDDNFTGPASRIRAPSALSVRDAVLEHMLLGLVDAVRRGESDLYADAAAQFLVAHLLTRHGTAPALKPTQRLPEQRVRRAVAHMRERLHESITLDDLAREASLSRYHFLRRFKASTGETPLRYLARLRMARARRLLEETELSVTAIAFQCGYESPTHFATAFRRIVGTTPSAYRASNRR